MATSPNFDLKERLDVCFKDTAALNLLCRSISSGMLHIHTHTHLCYTGFLFFNIFISLNSLRLLNNSSDKKGLKLSFKITFAL